jgi:GTP-binding protein
MLSMEGKGRMVIKFIPSRGIIGLRNQLTATGEAIMSHRFIGYEPFKEQFLNNGSLISMEMEKYLFYR